MAEERRHGTALPAPVRADGRQHAVAETGTKNATLDIRLPKRVGASDQYLLDEIGPRDPNDEASLRRLEDDHGLFVDGTRENPQRIAHVLEQRAT